MSNQTVYVLKPVPVVEIHADADVVYLLPQENRAVKVVQFQDGKAKAVSSVTVQQEDVSIETGTESLAFLILGAVLEGQGWFLDDSYSGAGQKFVAPHAVELLWRN